MGETTKKYYTFMIDQDLADRLKAAKERDGVPEAEQIRRALRAWFDVREKRMAASRKRRGAHARHVGRSA